MYEFLYTYVLSGVKRTGRVSAQGIVEAGDFARDVMHYEQKQWMQAGLLPRLEQFYVMQASQNLLTRGQHGKLKHDDC